MFNKNIFFLFGPQEHSLYHLTVQDSKMNIEDTKASNSLQNFHTE